MTVRARLLRLSAMLALLLAAGLSAAWFVQPGEAGEGPQKPSVLLGKPAPLLSGRAAFSPGLLNLQRLQNEIVYEKDASGQPLREGNRIKVHVVRNAVVLNFFATYCAPCVREIPTFNRIARAYEGRPVKFVYVNVDVEKTADEVRDFAKSKGIAVEMMLPSVHYAVQAYHIEALPRIVVVDRDGIVAEVITGFQEDLAKQIGAVLEPVLAKPVGAPAGKARGAGKRKAARS